MNKIIQITKEISENEHVLVELQGSITHSTEKNFSNLHLGKLEKVDEVQCIFNTSRIFILLK